MDATRRRFLELALTLGATAAWAEPHSDCATTAKECRDLFPEGVASGDPDAHSVILWTRRPYADRVKATLQIEVAEEPAFRRIVARSTAAITTESDWTCRVLVGNLKPAHVYWYRFVDDAGNASRTGRTITAPRDDDTRPARFTFVSCQNANLGEQHAYRRMIYEDERAPASQRLEFVLHLGDFVYEAMWYPEEKPGGLYGRRIRDVVRFPHGEKIADYHIPVTVEDYRALYRAYLRDADLQDARARWPFVCIWDNHEFSVAGWQSLQLFEGRNRPAQTVKVAANQAWFEYQPARVTQPGGSDLAKFTAPQVKSAPIEQFDDNGLGQEPNNLTAIASLRVHRTLRWGRNIDLLITDERSYRSEEPSGRPETKGLFNSEFPELVSRTAMEILDAGKAYADGNAPKEIRGGERPIANFRVGEPPQSILGGEQKRWFLQRLRESQATWKIWASSLGTLDYRADPQNLPPELRRNWQEPGYATFRGGDFSTAYHERAEIYDAVRESGVAGFVTVAGDRHSFWAGLAAPDLPPKRFEPVGIAFVTGSISSPGLSAKLEGSVPAQHPLRALYANVNMLVRHGVRSCLEYEKTGDLIRARKLSNPDLSPHLSFVDLDGHGYAVVRATRDSLECEFVCIPRPAERVDGPEGGPVRYRVVHRTPLWKAGHLPRIEQRVVEGDPAPSL